MKILRFSVKMIENKLINKMMRIADLFGDDEGIYYDYTFDVKVTDDPIIDDKYVASLSDKILKGIEYAGGEAISATLIEIIRGVGDD